MSSNNVFFYLFKLISYHRMVCPDPNCGNIHINCLNVCEVASGLLTPRGRHNWTKYSFKKTELFLRPVFALIRQALKNTDYIAIVMCIAFFVYWHLDKDSWLEDWWFSIQEEDSQ